MRLSIDQAGRIAVRALVLAAVLTLAGCGDDGGTNPPPPADPTPPTAQFLVLPPYGLIGTEFTFDASLSSDDEDSLAALEVRWDWEADGAWDTDYSLDKTALHRYDGAGTFPVDLEVRDSSGLTNARRTWVHIYNATGCTASAEPVAGTAPLTVGFDIVATGDHGIFSFFWTFGDGDTARTERPDHIFEAPGSYDVVVRVIDLVYTQPDCFDTVRIEVAAPPI